MKLKMLSVLMLTCLYGCIFGTRYDKLPPHGDRYVLSIQEMTLEQCRSSIPKVTPYTNTGHNMLAGKPLSLEELESTCLVSKCPTEVKIATEDDFHKSNETFLKFTKAKEVQYETSFSEKKDFKFVTANIKGESGSNQTFFTQMFILYRGEFNPCGIWRTKPKK